MFSGFYNCRTGFQLDIFESFCLSTKFINLFKCRLTAIDSFRWRIVSAERRPCFQFAFLLFSRPSGVLGPVLFPPCNRHLPLGMAGPRQAVLRLVFAPQRGDLCAWRSPVSHMGAWGLLLFFIFCPRLNTPCNNRLPTVRDVYALYDYRLLTASSNLGESQNPLLVNIH